MIRLRGMTWDHPRGRAPLVALAAHSGSRGDVSVEWSARSLQEFADYPLDQLAATYDLLVIDHPHIPLVAGEGIVLPLDAHVPGEVLGRLAAESVGASYASYEHDDHVWAFPIDAAAQVAVYRPDVSREVPRTWEDVLELARDGRVLWPSKPVDAMSSFLTLIHQWGGTVCAAPDRFVERTLGLTVLELMSELGALVPAACREENPIETAEHLASDEGWFYAPLSFGYVNYSRAGFRPVRLAFRNIPEGPYGIGGSCLGGAGIAVSASSAHRQEAVDVAAWLASAEVQRGPYYAFGGQPANAVAWDDPGVNADSMDFFRGTRDTLEKASTRPRVAAWLGVQDQVGELVHAMLARRCDAESCLNQIDTAWQRAADIAQGRRQ